MMIFTSIYYIVDGFFVSNYAGKTAFAAVNLIMPLLLVLGCVGFMFGTGGGALIAKTMGERKQDKANEIFTLIITVSALCGVVLAVLDFFLLRPVAEFMGARRASFLEQSIIYGRIILIALLFYILQFEFQCLFATAEKPKLGLYVTVASGVANMILDALLVGVIPLGVTGAAAATAISEFIGGVIPLLYFCTQKRQPSAPCEIQIRRQGAAQTCTNGSSEFMSNVSMSIVSMLYNMQLMKYAGADGVAAYGVLMYVSYDIPGDIYRICCRNGAYSRLQLRRAEHGRTRRSAVKKPAHNRRMRRIHVRCRRAFCKAAWQIVRRV